MIYECLKCECNKRLELLYKTKHKWLVSEANKLTKNYDTAQDLVQELYEYLTKKCNPSIFWGDSYNIFYCNKFLHSRFINQNKKDKINFSLSPANENIPEEEYDLENDLKFQKAHDEIIHSLKKLQTTKMWPKAKIFELYWMSDDTLEETSKKIGISKSTTFIAVKDMRKWLKNNIQNPFDNGEETKKDNG